MSLKRLLFLTVLFSITSCASIALAKTYDLPQIDSTISLSEKWFPINQEIVQRYNQDMLARRPQSKTRYIAGFTLGMPSTGMNLGSNYIWIQATSNQGVSITPEQLTSMLPKQAQAKKKEFERDLKDRIKSFEPGSSHYQERLGAIVYDTEANIPNGSTVNLRSYLIVTKSAIISINAYTTPSSADTFFEQVQGIVSTIDIKTSQKMSDSWLNSLRALMGKN
jgi:hypothetical protein